jgi:hypothetical protein
VIPAMKPSTPKTRGNGTSALKPNTQRGTRPAADHAAAQVKPIPIAPRVRRSQFRMIASDPSLTPQTSSASGFVAKYFVLQSTYRIAAVQESSWRSSDRTDREALPNAWHVRRCLATNAAVELPGVLSSQGAQRFSSTIWNVGMGARHARSQLICIPLAAGTKCH